MQYVREAGLSIVPVQTESDHHAASEGRTLTPTQLMKRLQVSENTIYWELGHGALKQIAFRIGRQWRVSERALEQLMMAGGA